MQISDMLGQYNRNVTNSAEELRGVQGTQKLVGSAGDLTAGSVFEGTVSQIKNGKVILALGNGQTVTARLDGKVDLKQGSSMFFQVKSNDGTTVAIRPYTGAGSSGNPVLFNALTAAQLPVTDRSLAMVDSMMREHMAIDKQSILAMARLLGNNPGANVQTLVQMTKIGLPVTEEMAAQFENYLSDRHAVLNELELAFGQMAETLADEGMPVEKSVDLYGKLVDILAGGEQNPGVVGNENGALPAKVIQNPDGSVTIVGNPDGSTVQNPGTDVAGNAVQSVLDAPGELPQGVSGENGSGAVQPGIAEDNTAWSGLSGVAENAVQQAAGQNPTMTLSDVLSEEQLASLNKALKNVPTLAGNSTVFAGAESEDIYVDTMQDDKASMQVSAQTEALQQVSAEAVLKKDMPVSEFLQALKQALTENSQYGYAGVQRLFAGKEFKELLKSMVEQQWLIKPEDLMETGKIGKLYEKIEQQLTQMEAAMKGSGIAQNSFLHTTANIQSNIEFMNQMNQIYNYVQMPLKMSGQNANGELYVYSNRKRLDDPDAELTAFLHLDLEGLGSTDVSVRMRSRQVKTNFYMEDDVSYSLVEKHLPILEKRLKNKGYTCSITITNEKKDINFKENFVKRGHGTSGSLQRYSFDVRA